MILLSYENTRLIRTLERDLPFAFGVACQHVFDEQISRRFECTCFRASEAGFRAPIIFSVTLCDTSVVRIWFNIQIFVQATE